MPTNLTENLRSDEREIDDEHMNIRSVGFPYALSYFLATGLFAHYEPVTNRTLLKSFIPNHDQQRADSYPFLSTREGKELSESREQSVEVL
jgi:hypothetical protein